MAEWILPAPPPVKPEFTGVGRRGEHHPALKPEMHTDEGR